MGDDDSVSMSGAFSETLISASSGFNSESYGSRRHKVNFSAASSSSKFGTSSTVQPASTRMLFCIKS